MNSAKPRLLQISVSAVLVTVRQRLWRGGGVPLGRVTARMGASAMPWSQIVPDERGSDADGPDMAPGRPLYRAIFISDIHLGTPGCQAEPLLDFLRWHDSESLYLIGDIIDGWQLRRRWYWPQSHNDVVQKLLRRARKGCKVVFVPGNHDEFARAFIGHSFGGCLLYTSPSPRDRTRSRMPSSA